MVLISWVSPRPLGVMYMECSSAKFPFPTRPLVGHVCYSVLLLKESQASGANIENSQGTTGCGGNAVLIVFLMLFL